MKAPNKGMQPTAATEPLGARQHRVPLAAAADACISQTKVGVNLA